MFNIGDKVKVIPPTYLEVSKGFFLYPENWNISNPSVDEAVMLGGEYEILEFFQEHPLRLFYSLLPNGKSNRGHVISKLLIKSEDVKRCKFKKGDFVKFKPTCDDNDQKTLHMLFDKLFGFDDPNKQYKVTFVLNEYYIFLELPNGDEYRWPFRWLDFIKC